MLEVSSDNLDKLAGLGERWKTLHGQLSKFGKVFDKKIKGELIDLVSPDEIDPVQDDSINQCLLQHLYREGNFEVADVLTEELSRQKGEEGGGLKKITEWREPFEEVHRLIRALKEKEIRPAIEWIEKNKEKLGMLADQLKFKLHSLAYLELLKDGKSSLIKTLAYAQRNIRQYEKMFLKDVETLLGALAYHQCLETSPYAILLKGGGIVEGCRDNARFCLLLSPWFAQRISLGTLSKSRHNSLAKDQ